jgi:hypothetical protein
VSQPPPLLLIAGQVCPPYLAARLVAGALDATMDQNGSGYRLFTPPSQAVTDSHGLPATTVEAARVVRTAINGG